LRALVVYESMFGNTLTVAKAVAEGVESVMPVELIEVANAPALIPADVSLVVVGGPTHAHGLTNADTRADAARRAGDQLVSRGGGIREWLDRVRAEGPAPRSAVFDTRIKGPKLLWGSAARGAATKLEGVGFRLVRPAESFLVDGPTGPLFDRLLPGEAERARSWGAHVAAAVGSLAPAR
jgi:hypothetical protein